MNDDYSTTTFCHLSKGKGGRQPRHQQSRWLVKRLGTGLPLGNTIGCHFQIRVFTSDVHWFEL